MQFPLRVIRWIQKRETGDALLCSICATILFIGCKKQQQPVKSCSSYLQRFFLGTDPTRCNSVKERRLISLTCICFYNPTITYNLAFIVTRIIQNAARLHSLLIFYSLPPITTSLSTFMISNPVSQDPTLAATLSRAFVMHSSSGKHRRGNTMSVSRSRTVGQKSFSPSPTNATTSYFTADF